MLFLSVQMIFYLVDANAFGHYVQISTVQNPILNGRATFLGKLY